MRALLRALCCERPMRCCDARRRRGEEGGIGEQDARLVVRSVARRGGELRVSVEGARAARRGASAAGSAQSEERGRRRRKQDVGVADQRVF